MQTIFEFLFLILAVFYSAAIFFFYFGIRQEKKRATKLKDWQPTVTVIIPARNEANRIVTTLESISKQSYPDSLLEVIIVDDQSSDDTGEVVKEFIGRNNLDHFKLLSHHNDGEKPTYKKTAISYGLRFARGEVIMTTDADCSVQPDWIASMVNSYDEETGLVCGLITFCPEGQESIFYKLQTLEFAGVVFSGIGAIGNNFPLICNGSNLSYRRAAFEEVGGFDGHEHIPSGDDDLFMQSLHRFTKWKIRYNLDPQSINFTHAVDTLKKFINQRARWASKGSHYPGVKISALLLMIYLFYLMLLILTPAALAGLFPAKYLLLGFALKLLPEFLVIRQALGILNRRELLPWFFLAEIVQIPYIVIAGFAGFFNLFKWKSIA